MADKIFSVADGLHDELPSINTAKAGRMLITTDRGEVYYEPEDKERIQVNPQADWQQNDETANDYIKNRPGGYEDFIEIFPETTLEFSTKNFLVLSNLPSLELNTTYIVTYEDSIERVEYTLTSKVFTGPNIIYIGNGIYGGFPSSDTGEPFLIYTYNNSTRIYISSTETLPCTHTIKIKCIAPIKIEEKYLDIKNTNIVNGSAVGSLRTVGSAKERTSYEIGDYAFTEGNNTEASGDYSHAEGNTTRSLGFSSHSEGQVTQAKGNYSHAEGFTTIASGSNSHAEGNGSQALGNNAHAEGSGTIAGQMGFKVTACEKLTDTTGTYTLTSVTGLAKNQYYSVYLSSSKEDCGKITAIDTTNKKITVDGYPNIALSTSSSTTANYLTIVDKPELGDILISGSYSHAEGQSTKALGNMSHAEGAMTIASQTNSHAEGASTTASGFAAHAEGTNTTASGANSHAEGQNTTAKGETSHAEGQNTTAKGDYSHAEGLYTTASSVCQHVQGKFNIDDKNNIYADIIGNGKDPFNCSNAYTLDWDGNGWFSGDVYTGSTSGTNRDEGSKKLATEAYVAEAIEQSNIYTKISKIEMFIDVFTQIDKSKVYIAANDIRVKYKNSSTSDFKTIDNSVILKNSLITFNAYTNTEFQSTYYIVTVSGKIDANGELYDNAHYEFEVDGDDRFLAIEPQYFNLSPIDLEYIPFSTNPQSGKAVAEAVVEAKDYTDTKIGDINTALDSIIEIQNSLIGGN